MYERGNGIPIHDAISAIFSFHSNENFLCIKMLSDNANNLYEFLSHDEKSNKTENL